MRRMDEQNSGKTKAAETEKAEKQQKKSFGSDSEQTRYGRMIAAWTDDRHARQLCDTTHIFILLYESKLPLF